MTSAFWIHYESDTTEVCRACGADDPDWLENTYCGTLCHEHLCEHVQGCEMCAKDWQQEQDEDEYKV